MKRFLLATGFFAAFLAGDWQAAVDPSSSGGSFVRPAAAYDNYDNDAYQDFQQALQPYGQWVGTPQYGQVWIPANMPQGWRPYTNGHWDYTNDYGWVWVSDYEWGWAPFHYGRWTFDQQYGWMWVPGRTWGPAWVSFRYGDSYVGWAPLPPEGYDAPPSYGYEPSINIAFWNFVPRQHFNDRYVDRYYGNHNDNNNYYHKTKNVTNITVINNRVVNNSININNYERDTRQRVVRHNVDVADTFVPGNQRKRGNDLVVVRPKDVERNAGGKPKIQWQQYGNRNQGDQNGAGKNGNNNNNADNGKNWNNGNNGNNGQRTVTTRDQGKPNQNPVVIPPPNGKPDNARGAGQNNGQGGTAKNQPYNGNNNKKANDNANNGRNKPAPVIIPPTQNGNNGNQGQPQKLGQANGNNNNGGNDQRKREQEAQQQQLFQQQMQQQQQQRQQQRAQQQQVRQQQFQKNNGQGGQPNGNNPPAHAQQNQQQKKKGNNDCGNNGNCNNN